MVNSGNPQHLVVIGGGMVAQRLVEALRARDDAGRYRVTVFAEEPRAPYDRVGLTRWFEEGPEGIALGDPALWADPLVTLHTDRKIESIDRAAKTVTTGASGRDLIPVLQLTGLGELVYAAGVFTGLLIAR